MIYATYVQPTVTGQASAISSIGLALAGALMQTPGSLESAGAIDYIGNQMYGAGPWLDGPDDWQDSDAPKAFLNYIFFNEDFVMVAYGADQISIDARTQNEIASFDLMELDFEAKEQGYLYVFLSNENPQIIDVYFDDFKIAYEHTHVIVQEDFYPFGLAFNQSADRSLKNKYLYNGKELQDELGLDVYDYIARNYDPALGRFWQIDPAADLMRRFSPYSYSFDNPIRFTDPDGMMPSDPNCPECSAQIAMQQLGQQVDALQRNVEGFVNKVSNAIASTASSVADAVVSTLNGGDELVQGNGSEQAGGVPMYSEVGNAGPQDAGVKATNPDKAMNVDGLIEATGIGGAGKFSAGDLDIAELLNRVKDMPGTIEEIKVNLEVKSQNNVPPPSDPVSSNDTIRTDTLWYSTYPPSRAGYRHTIVIDKKDTVTKKIFP